ncbi:cytochrome P450 [Achlya hypogyna]|uniref:Cytochrome P450 n=1 Tax=Achlya hypogyna TaxID=1202772 RepID=A0A0A7CNT8_ACHHY|nr:secreted protein [Achlya hypogyna]OQR87466.1 cytochrome P450 [Achlya hypogyna]
MLFLLVSIFVALVLYHRWSHRHHNGYPYVVSMIPYLGASFHFRHGAVRCVQNWVARHGTIFNITVLGEPLTLVADAALFPTISKHPSMSLLPLKLRMMRVGFGASSYDTLHRDVQLAISAATRKSINGQIGRHKPSLDAINEVSVAKLNAKLQLPPGQTTVTVYPWLNQLLFETLTDVFYGEELATPAFRADFDAWDAKFTGLYAGIPAKWLGVEAARDRLLSHLHDYAATGIDHLSVIVQERLQICRENGVTARDTDGHQLSFVWAMTTNTIRTCFWTLYYLQQDPSAWAAVVNEIEAAGVDGSEWRRDAVERCVLLDSAIKETLRVALNSSAVRYALEDLTLQFPDGRSLRMKSGDGLVMQSNIGYFDAAKFEDPFTYHFDRFAVQPELAKDFTPFGFGKYLCPGQHFATDFVKSVLIALARQTVICDFRGESALKHNSVGVYVPKEPLAVTMTLQRRTAPSA